MKLSASGWLALFGVLTSRNSSQLNERQAKSEAPDPRDNVTETPSRPSLTMFPAPLGTFTLPPGPQTLVVSEDTIAVIEIFTGTTITTTWTNTAWFITTEGPVIYYPPDQLLPGATLYVEGDSSLLVTATATAPTTESVLTSATCSSSVCSPTPIAIDYTCGVSGNVTLPVTTVMQSFSCTAGQVCEGVPVKTALICNCGEPICTTVLPLLPIPPIVIPVGAPIPPAVPPPPEVPGGVPDPEITITEDPTRSPPPTSTSDENSDEPTSTDSDSKSSVTSSTSSSTSSSSSSTSASSATSNSLASACSIGGFTIATNFEATLSAWLAQFPFTIAATFSSNITNTVSKPSTANSTALVTISSLTDIPKPSSASTLGSKPAPSQTPSSGPKSTSASCNAACSSSAASASSAFEVSLSLSMAAGQSSFTRSLSSVLASQSASISSVQQAQSAVSKCQHYTIPYPWNPPDLPATLATYHGNSDGGRWMCVIDPNQIDTTNDWNSTWDYQPFGIDKSWDRDHPKNTLVDTFCEYLANEHADVTPLGEVQGVCQAYDLGQCLTPTRSGGCTYWEHPWTTLDTWGPVMISVSYDRTCPTEKNSKPVDFRAVGAAGCKKSLNALVNSCSFPKNKQKNWAEDDPTVGGTIWSDCMVYTIVGIKEGDKPNIIWQNAAFAGGLNL